MKRVAITGLGAVSAFGTGVPALWQALVAARSGIRRLTIVPADSLRSPIAGEVPDFDPSRWFTEAKRSMLDRFAQFALVAAAEALADAGLALDDNAKQRTGVSLGTGMGGAISEDDAYVRMYREGRRSVHPLTIPRLMYNSATSQVSMELGLQGPALCISTACASGTHAIGEAVQMIRHGRADVMLAGGADSPLSYGALKAWEAMRILAPVPKAGPQHACRPFSRDRQGVVLGEGAATLVLEDRDRALARGARIYGEVSGYGATADAGHITQPSVEAPARAIRLALADAGLPPEAIGYVNAHGTGTPLNDSTETRILKEVFGAHAYRLAVSSTKSMHGHAMGASGAIELVATVLALHHGVLPPTINYAEPDPECDLDYVPNQARPCAVTAAVSNSFAFGGLNAVLVVTRNGATHA